MLAEDIVRDIATPEFVAYDIGDLMSKKLIEFTSIWLYLSTE